MKFLSLLIALSIVLSCFAVSAHAADLDLDLKRGYQLGVIAANGENNSQEIKSGIHSDAGGMAVYAVQGGKADVNVKGSISSVGEGIVLFLNADGKEPSEAEISAKNVYVEGFSGIDIRAGEGKADVLVKDIEVAGKTDRDTLDLAGIRVRNDQADINISAGSVAVIADEECEDDIYTPTAINVHSGFYSNTKIKAEDIFSAARGVYTTARDDGNAVIFVGDIEAAGDGVEAVAVGGGNIDFSAGNIAAAGTGILASTARTNDFFGASELHISADEIRAEGKGLAVSAMDKDSSADISVGGIESVDDAVSISSDMGANTSVVITGDVKSKEGVAFDINAEDGCATAIAVDGAVDSEGSLMRITLNPKHAENQNYPEIAVWKLEDACREGMVEVVWRDKRDALENNEEFQAMKQEAAEIAAGKIMYIIRAEQPGSGAAIELLREDGTALDDFCGYKAAKAGEKIVIRVALEEGYALSKIFNGVGAVTEIAEDENGEYSIVVPENGGVCISADIVAPSGEIVRAG